MTVRWGEKRYYSLDYYLKTTYGEKLYKISLDGGMTCPNRDGTLGTRGCIFCSRGGSGDFAESHTLSVTEQIESGKKQSAKKYTGSSYIAYFQAYTNTYASLAYLEKLYMEAILHPDKAVKSKGRVVEMARQDEKTLLYWVAGNVKKEGYKIKEQTARYLLSTTGTDMENLEKELEKLFCYCMGKEEIEVRDIEAICTTQITNKIFEMVEAVAVRNQKKALDYYYDLLALKEPPMRILYLLTRQFKLLLEVKDLAGKRYDKAAIAKTVGLHPFVAGKYMQQCRTFEKKELRSILEDAVDTEELVKTGRLNDVMSVELFIVKYSAA